MLSHRKTGTPEHKIWKGMRYRCNSTTSSSFPYYGGRGIKVCDRWDDFEAFLADMGPRPSPGHTIDRINVDGNYEPANCRWVVRAEQNRNKRTSRWVTVGGKKMLFIDACRQAGMNHSVVIQKLAHGMTIEQALTRMRRTSNTRLSEDAKARIIARHASGETKASIMAAFQISGRYLATIVPMSRTRGME